MSTTLAGLTALVAGTALLAGPQVPRVRLPGAADVARRRARSGPVLWLALGSGVVPVGWLVGLGLPLIPVLCGFGVLLAVGRQVIHRRNREAARSRAAQVLRMCDGLAADLRAGLDPHAALAAAARDWPEFEPVARAAVLGADVPLTLRLLAARPGAAQLRTVAAAWAVARRTGASLADAASGAARTIRQQQAAARVVAGELAGAEATARLLVLLPAGVLLLGRGIGGDPVGFLVGTLAGQLCLAMGLALGQVGLSWMQHIADRIEE